MVIKMGRGQVNIQLVFQQIHGKEQRHGIRPAGHRADKFVSRLKHPVFFQERSQLIQHASTPGP